MVWIIYTKNQFNSVCLRDVSDYFPLLQEPDSDVVGRSRERDRWDRGSSGGMQMQVYPDLGMYHKVTQLETIENH
jgi:hypothetical protein